MKKKFIALAMAGCLVSAWSQAQLKKGSQLIGGSIGFSSTTSNFNWPNSTKREVKRTTIYASPSYATAVADNLFVGADLIFGQTKDKYDPAPAENWKQYKPRTYGGGVFVRKYWNIVDKLYIFGQGRLGYQYTQSDVAADIANENSTKTKGNFFSASLYPGLSLALSRKVHLESTFLNLITLNYTSNISYNKKTGTEQDSYKYFDVSSSLNSAAVLNIGVKILLAK